MPRSLAVTAVLAGALALAACGGGSEPSDTGSSLAASAGGSSAAPAAGAVTYQGVTVSNPTDLTKASNPTSSSSKTPAKLEYKDLVVGTGKEANASSTVTVQYEGVLYKDGTAFDSSWSRGGQPASFSLMQVVPGFTQGIGGTDGVPPMKEGGRRVMILPAELGYGAQATGAIPANSPLVFVVDLVSVS
ncbi:FKBP-type peptidyl-prolyl cis-trans isomerase [Spongisporangium articulatum]|uniref:Peptidyl-prolyl cis-trans isomerase n=1 Tax=Spongisporangium articulatum TaxID=3362603 RepID=A0ABW8AJG5_9ACTN